MYDNGAQSLVPGLMLVSLVLIALAAFIIYLVYLNQYKVRLMQMERRRLAETFEQQLLQSQVEIQETTVRRISEEIHDNVGQLLSIAKLTLSQLEGQSPDQTAALQSSGQLIQQSLNELRQLAHSLHAGHLLQLGLEQAVRNEVERLMNTHAFAVDMQVQGQRLEEDGHKNLIAFRIFQELLTNIIRHANASAVRIAMAYSATETELIVEDDGVGFVPELALQKKASGIGLSNMMERAKTIGGSLSFLQNPTRAVLRFSTAPGPLPA